jgi:periplasmic divalent cation tolerance protein
MAKNCQLLLTCADKAEADKIASALLREKLVACVKQMSVGSDFLWKGKIDHNDEVLLVMDSREDLFEQIEAEVDRLHSYETFVLQAVPVIRVSKRADSWLQKNLKKL